VSPYIELNRVKPFALIQPAEPISPLGLFGLFAFGGWLFIGGWISITEEKWPGFMPPQLDIIALAGWLTSEKWAALIGGGLVLFLGAALALLAVVAVVKQRAV
jgi:hypothetical protein